MTTTVLAYFPSPGQGVWYLGPVPIRAYALCIIAGIIAALVIGDRRWTARGGERGVIYDIALWAVPFGLIGGRLYHLMTDWRTYFGPGGAGISAALRIWEGGLGIWGAVALGGVGSWIACRRRGIPLPAFGDAIAPGIVLAQAIGRLGNYFNQELYGRETTVPWGMEIFYRRDSSGVLDVHSLDGISTGQVAAVVHPTFLYELLWNLAVFVLLIVVDRKFKMGHGRLFALYVAAYCVGRFWVELLRDDTATLIAGIRINVFTATFVFIGAVVYILLAPKGREDPATLRGHEPVETAAEEAVEEFAEDLLESAAKGSGLLAAVTVAGKHEDEDSGEPAPTEADTDETPDQDEPEAVEVVETVEGPETAEAPEVPDTLDVETDEVSAEVEPPESPESADEPDAGEGDAAEGDAAEGDAGESDAQPDSADGDDSQAEVPEATEDHESRQAEDQEDQEDQDTDAAVESAPVEDQAESTTACTPSAADEPAAPEVAETDVVESAMVVATADEKATKFSSSLRRLLWGAQARD